MNLAAFIENHGIDAVNAIAAPILLALLTGVPLSLYTGLIAARYSAFFSEMQRARYSIFMTMEALPKVMTASDKIDFRDLYVRALLGSIMALRHEHRQHEAANRLSAIADSLEDVFAGVRNEFEKTAADCMELTEEQKQTRWDRYLAFVRERVEQIDTLSQSVSAIRPNMWGLAGLPCIGAALHRISSYLDGSAEDLGFRRARAKCRFCSKS